MDSRGRFQRALAIQRSNGSAVTIEQADSEVFVETKPVGQFFLQSFANALGHGGIKRRSASVRRFRAKRYANARLPPKSASPLRSCSFSEARGRAPRAL